MHPLGTTRTTVQQDHALITPESHVISPLTGWGPGIILISPQIGARFIQYLALMEPNSQSKPLPVGRERLIYVLEGNITVASTSLTVGGYAYLPSGADVSVTAKEISRLLVFERVYQEISGVAVPEIVMGQEQDVEGKPFMGDPDAVLKTLLPEIPAFDMAVNIFAFQPGAALPLVEVHVMEHGLMMLDGSGVYRLGESWYPVQAGDTIWMASYCPQWFVAMGKTQSRYIYYKDIHRDPLLTSF